MVLESRLVLTIVTNPRIPKSSRELRGYLTVIDV